MKNSKLIMESILILYIMIFSGILACARTDRSFEGKNKVFIDVTEETNLRHKSECFSACWGDINGDGLLDIFVVNHFNPPPSLFSNKGDGTFDDVAAISGIAKEADYHGCAIADYDNDGDEDIYISVGASAGIGAEPNYLYQNNGNGKFMNVALKAGVANPKGRGRTVSWVDYDNDGHLDLFVANGMRDDVPSVLFKNNGDGTFSDVSVNAGLDIVDELIEANWVDDDNDGFMDLVFVVRRKGHRVGEINIYRNLQNGTFKKVKTFDGNTYTWGDYDNDGDIDLFVSIPPRMYIKGYEISALTRIFKGSNRLYENKGNGQFIDISDKAGLKKEMGGHKAVFFDYDNDGDIDIYLLINDTKNDIINDMVINNTKKNIINDVIFENNGDKTFTNATKKIDMIQGSVYGKGCSVTYADYNNDGNLDLFLTNGKHMWSARHEKIEPPSGPHVLYKNKGNNNHWLKLRLRGAKSNRDGIGARVRLYAGNKVQYRQSNGGMEGYSQHSRIIHFGIGDATIVDKIEIIWPSKNISVLTNIKTDQMLDVKENNQG